MMNFQNDGYFVVEVTSVALVTGSNLLPWSERQFCMAIGAHKL